MDLTTDSPLELIEEMNRTASDIASRDAEKLTARVMAPTEDLEVFFQSLAGKRVLDVGCGWGYYAERFAAAGLEYRGIDVSAGMLAAARKRNPQLTFEQMSFRKLDFPDASFDGLCCCCSLYYEPKRNIQNVFREMHRVLAPGGILYIVERLSDLSDEEVRTSSISGSPMYWSYYEFEEFNYELHRSPFSLLSSKQHPAWGSMSFLARK